MQRPINFYTCAGLDRADDRREDAAWLAERLADPGSRLLPLWQSRSLFDSLEEGAAPRPVIFGVDALEALARHGGTPIFLGLREEVAHFALDLTRLQEPDHEPALAGRGSFADLRAVGMLLPREEGAMLAYARALVSWHARHGFCSACGAPSEASRGGHQRRCSDAACGASHFPRIDPAVIMLVHDGGDRCVLGRQKIWRPGMHSTLAGFVEPGESLEEAVAREVFEEVGLRLRVEEVSYHSSQPWPFPSSLMLGFHARADYAPLRVHPQELESARWFTRAELLNSPEDESFNLPRRDAVSYRLIEDWLAGG